MRSSPRNEREFVFGSYIYHYSLIKQDRKSLSLTVTPDLQICLKCPNKASDERIEIFLKRKWFWLEKQLSFFRRYQRKLYKKEYVSGEGFLYLGRQYKLLVKPGRQNKVLLTKGHLTVTTVNGVRDGKYTKKLLDGWYQEKMEKVFSACFTEMKKKFDYKVMPDLVIREMRKRWGSFVSKKKIVLNPLLIQAPRECIDYVITHELCHMQYKDHGKKFWVLLGKKYPGWEKIKEKLEIRLG